MLDYGVQRPQHSAWSQLAILLCLSGVGLLIGSVLSIPIATAYLKVPLQNLPEALTKSENVNLSRALQFITTFFFMAVPAFIFARIVNRSNSFKFIGFNSAISGKQVFIIVGVVFMCIILSGILAELNEIIPISKSAEKYFKGLEDEYNKEMLAIANITSLKDYIISLIIIALLPALFEEMLFRGALQPIMIKISKHAFAGILITSILFSAIHMSYYGFLPRLALGIIIGYVFYFSKNLWLSSLTHFLYNAFGVSQLYWYSLHGGLNLEKMNDQPFPFYYGLLSIVVLIMAFVSFKKESEVVLSMYNLGNNTN